MIFHSFRTALSSRILREESTAELDNYLLQRYDEWRDFERTLGIEIDLRVISFLFSTEDDLEHAVPWLEYDGPEEGRGAWRMSVIYGLFWGRGRDIRNKNLNYFLNRLNRNIYFVEFDTRGQSNYAFNVILKNKLKDL